MRRSGQQIVGWGVLHPMEKKSTDGCRMQVGASVLKDAFHLPPFGTASIVQSSRGRDQ